LIPEEVFTAFSGNLKFIEFLRSKSSDITLYSKRDQETDNPQI